MAGSRGAHRRLGSDAGVSVIEMVVAVAVMTVSVVGVTRVVTSAGQASEVAEQRRVATDIASSEIERAWALPFDRLAIVGSLVGVLEGLDLLDELGAIETVVDATGLVQPLSEIRRSGIGYEVERAVSWVGGVGGRKQVVVVVSWENARGESVEVRAETQRTDGGSP